MMESANSINTDDYDFGSDSQKSKSTYEREEDESNNSSVNSSLDFLPGTSSKPLVLVCIFIHILFNIYIFKDIMKNESLSIIIYIYINYYFFIYIFH